jgi:hypothetical protein
MKIKYKLIFSFIFTFVLITFILWNCFIRIRLPKDLTNIIASKSDIVLLVIIITVFTCLAIYFCLCWLKIVPNENSKFSKFINRINSFLCKYKWFNNFLDFFYTHVIKGPLNTFEYLYKFVDIRPYISRIQEIMVYKLNYYRRILYVIIFIILRFVIAITFLVEIAIYEQIKYFYYLLVLLLLPLITKFLLFFSNYNAKSNIDYLEEYYDFEYEDEDFKNLIINKKNIIDERLLKERDSFDLTLVGNLYHFYQQIYRFVYFAEEDINNNKYWVNALYYTIITIGFFIYFLILIKAW